MPRSPERGQWTRGKTRTQGTKICPRKILQNAEPGGTAYVASRLESAPDPGYEYDIAPGQGTPFVIDVHPNPWLDKSRSSPCSETVEPALSYGDLIELIIEWRWNCRWPDPNELA